MLTITNSSELELPLLYKLERACHAHPWTLGILQDCLRTGYLCHTFRLLKHTPNLNNHCAAIPMPHLINRTCCEDPIGFMINQVILDECHLLTICICPDLQGLGLATAALTWLIELMRSKSIKTLLLEVRASNSKAIALYEKLGFSKLSIRKNYYPVTEGQEDAWVMQLRIE